MSELGGGLTTIELEKEAFHFSAAHFTLFSATERENLHGHNYQVRCRISCSVKDHGLAFDYTGIKQRLKELCDALDECTLMPSLSPWLKIHESSSHTVVEFDGEELRLPNRDLRLLPVTNVSLEALAEYLGKMLIQTDQACDWPMRNLTLGVSSSPGIWAEVTLIK